MTAQIGDSICYAGQYYNLVGVSPDHPSDELFDQERFGIRTFSNCTACWRGFVATYGLRENRLILEELKINVRNSAWGEELQRIDELQEIWRNLPPHQRGTKPRPKKWNPGPYGPPIHGVFPAAADDPKATFAFTDNYLKIGLPLPFSGGLLLGDGFIQELYEHMGFHPAWKFQKVIELIFTEGRLTAARDRSAKMAEIREAKDGSDGKTSKTFSSPEKIVGWIDGCFNRSY